jgi:putative endonuclease
MAFIYILQSESTGRFYIGSTNDLERRLSEHTRAHSLATRGRGPWKLVHQESLATLLLARQREREIKNWKSAKKIVDLLGQRDRQTWPTC